MPYPKVGGSIPIYAHNFSSHSLEAGASLIWLAEFQYNISIIQLNIVEAEVTHISWLDYLEATVCHAS